MRADPNDNRWVGLDVLAEALGVTPKHARKIADQEDIRTTRTRPAEYHWGDIVTTNKRRKGQQTMSTTTATVPIDASRPEFTPRRLPARVMAFTPDEKAIVQTTIGRLTIPWIDDKPELGAKVAIQGTSSTGATWTWIIIGPADLLEPHIEPGTPLARYTALVRAKTMEEAAGIATKRNGGYEISIDLLTRSHEIREEAGIA